MKRLTIQEIEVHDARTLLEDAVSTSAALLEAIAELLSMGEQSPHGLMLSAATVDGLLMLARERGETLRNHFQVLVEVMRSNAQNARSPDSDRAGKHREAAIPQAWEEVAFIDFSGLDRDCEERVIYKTPGGKLKASKSCENEPVVIEDVTREQVVRWILECVIPEEFEPDFSLGHHVPKRPGATQSRAFSTSAKLSK